MSAARPLSSLLTAGALVALSLAAPGTALADPAHGAESKQDPGAAGRQEAKKGEPAQERRAAGEEPGTGEPADAEPRKPTQGKPAKAAPPAEKKPATSKAAKDKPAKDETGKPASQPAATTTDTDPQPASGDPAGNNGTIKIDTVPADPDRANRPHPGCAFVVQFFNFDTGQHADITFTGQAPTRSAGPLLTLENQLISTTPADGALEEGYSLTLTAADLGLLGSPTAAKGWHVKVAVDAIEAPGGAKQKVFWLDCATGEAAVEQEPDEADVADAGAADGIEHVEDAEAPSVVEPDVADRRLIESSGEVAVLSGAVDRDVSTAGRAVDGGVVRAQDAGPEAAQGRSTSSTLASVLPFAVPAALPFTGAAGVTGMLVAGLGAVAAGALALRAGRRRTTG